MQNWSLLMCCFAKRLLCRKCVSSKTSLLGTMLDCLLEEKWGAGSCYKITTWPWKTNHDSILCLLVNSFRNTSSFFFFHCSKALQTQNQVMRNHGSKGWFQKALLSHFWHIPALESKDDFDTTVNLQWP